MFFLCVFTSIFLQNFMYILHLFGLKLDRTTTFRKCTRIEIGVSAYSSGSSGQTDLPRPEYVPSVWTYLLLWTANNCALLLASIVEKVFFKVIHNGYCCSDKCWYTLVDKLEFVLADQLVTWYSYNYNSVRPFLSLPAYAWCTCVW